MLRNFSNDSAIRFFSQTVQIVDFAQVKSNKRLAETQYLMTSLIFAFVLIFFGTDLVLIKYSAQQVLYNIRESKEGGVDKANLSK